MYFDIWADASWEKEICKKSNVITIRGSENEKLR